MSSIRITVRGLKENIEALNRIVQELPNTNREIIQESSDFFVQELKQNAHMISGKMRDSIRANIINNDSAVVGVYVPYAQKENQRKVTKGPFNPPPHNFADRAYPVALKEHYNNIGFFYTRLFENFIV